MFLVKFQYRFVSVFLRRASVELSEKRRYSPDTEAGDHDQIRMVRSLTRTPSRLGGAGEEVPRRGISIRRRDARGLEAMETLAPFILLAWRTDADSNASASVKVPLPSFTALISFPNARNDSPYSSVNG